MKKNAVLGGRGTYFPGPACYTHNPVDVCGDADVKVNPEVSAQ